MSRCERNAERSETQLHYHPSCQGVRGIQQDLKHSYTLSSSIVSRCERNAERSETQLHHHPSSQGVKEYQKKDRRQNYTFKHPSCQGVRGTQKDRRQSYTCILPCQGGTHTLSRKKARGAHTSRRK